MKETEAIQSYVIRDTSSNFGVLSLNIKEDTFI